MEPAGDRWWAIGGAVYMLQAIKRVRGMRLITPAWQEKAAREKPLVAAAKREGHDQARPPEDREVVNDKNRGHRQSTSIPTARARAIPGPGAGASCSKCNGEEREMFGGEAVDHQQPHGDDRGDRGAGAR